MLATFSSLKVGSTYHRKNLASLWKCKGWQAISRGIITPSNARVIILFITRDKSPYIPQYEDNFDGERLTMDGEEAHGSDARLINSSARGDEVHLFYRLNRDQDFTYQGCVELESFTQNSVRPSRFTFRLANHAIGAHA